MGKSILIISASPRKGGNSDTLCDQFKKGAEEAGHRVEKLRLAELKIDYCSACYACKKIEHCVKQDDMEQGISKMRKSDVIVLATPVYFYTMCAQMKTMIDRTLGGAQKAGLENKEFYLIATAADGKAGMERTVDGLRGYLAYLPGAQEMGVIYGAETWQIGDIQKNPAMQNAYKMGKSRRFYFLRLSCFNMIIYELLD